MLADLTTVHSGIELSTRELRLCDRFGLSPDSIAREVPAGQLFGDAIAARVPRLGRGLEVACGAGAVASRLSPSPLLTDVDPRRVNHAAARTGLPVGLACSAEALPFADASFDCVLLVRVLHVIPSPQMALQEVRRVLVPDGTLAIGFTLPGLRDDIDSAMAPLFPDRTVPAVESYPARLAAALRNARLVAGEPELLGWQARAESPEDVARVLEARKRRGGDARTLNALGDAQRGLMALPEPDRPRQRPVALHLMLARPDRGTHDG